LFSGALAWKNSMVATRREEYDNSKQQGSSTNNLFLTGSKNHKFSTISDHEKSKTHVEEKETLWESERNRDWGYSCWWEWGWGKW
jgi:hypothetical protein